VPIDKSFRTSWSVTSKHEGHSVWESKNQKAGPIHGDIVGVHFSSCIGCMKCIDACPVDVFAPFSSDEEVVDPIRDGDCILCLVCEIVCPTEAISIKRESGSQETLDSLLGGV
jgi:NAD-dependent dihydropyrimidine dehydrogenase PreA subunit